MVQCPECTSQRVWKDGIRKTSYGDVQRYLCRCCGFRFSRNNLAKPFYTPSSKGSTCQVGAALSPRRVKNLVKVEPLKEGLAGATKPTDADIKGKLIEYLWYLKKQGYAETTSKNFDNRPLGFRLWHISPQRPYKHDLIPLENFTTPMQK